MYNKSAKIYDAIYASHGKDYAAEAEKLHSMIQQHKKSPGNLLLDVACGTGNHAEQLNRYYQVEGLDLSQAMLGFARQKCPDIPFHQGDMVSFHLSHAFDVVTCLFSAIGSVKTKERLEKAIQTMGDHLLSGGVLVVEPWYQLQDIKQGKIHATFVDEPDLKIARMSISKVEGTVFILEFHYLVATPDGIENFVEIDELGLFTPEEYLEAFRKAGLDVIHDPEGIYQRGLYIGVKA